MLIYNYIGLGIEDFQYTACMGAETPDIYKQVQNLKGDLDLVAMKAGGNDLCLVHIIINCVTLAFFGDKECDNILGQAKKNLDNIVNNNIKELLLGLKPKMSEDGVVVYSSYAQYFNTEDEDYATKEYWGLGWWIKFGYETFF